MYPPEQLQGFRPDLNPFSSLYPHPQEIRSHPERFLQALKQDELHPRILLTPENLKTFSPTAAATLITPKPQLRFYLITREAKYIYLVDSPAWRGGGVEWSGGWRGGGGGGGSAYLKSAWRPADGVVEHFLFR